jgi:hypothetical protein
MKIIIVLLFFIIIATGNHEIMAADIEIGNAIAHSGIARFGIRINNIPNPVSNLKFLVPLDNRFGGNNGDCLVGVAKDNVATINYGYQSGSADGIFVDISFKEPLPRGSNGPLFYIPIYVNDISTPLPLTLTNIEGDISGWSIQDGQFTYSRDDNQNPVANAGNDKMCISSVNLDGSKCYDPDGTIISWIWLLTHRTNHLYDRKLSGRNVTVDDLPSGVYDVQLTVVDNASLASTDFMVLVASGNYLINGDADSNGMIGLEDAIMTLQTVSGLR